MAILFILVSALLLAGCASVPGGQVKNQTNQTPPPPPPNPNGTGTSAAAKFCTDAGYKIHLITSSSGQGTYCVFPNGHACAQEAFYKGDCSDYDSLEMVESPGFVQNPKEVRYKFFADGRLVLTENELRNGTSTTLIAWLSPADFAHFIKDIKAGGFESFSDRYESCGNSSMGCPSDMPSISLTLLRQGVEKKVYLYGVADRPAALGNIILGFKDLFEQVTFVQGDVSGCTLMKTGASLQCFGCPKGITNPKCTNAPVGSQTVGPSLGSCTIDAQGACSYQPNPQIGKAECETSGGRWNECGAPESCRDPRLDRMCIDMCVSYCECGAGVGTCPTGYFCTQLVPAANGSGQVGICKPIY